MLELVMKYLTRVRTLLAAHCMFLSPLPICNTIFSGTKMNEWLFYVLIFFCFPTLPLIEFGVLCSKLSWEWNICIKKSIIGVYKYLPHMFCKAK